MQIPPDSFLADYAGSKKAVLDTSAVINILGTGIAHFILAASQYEIFVDQKVFGELLRHPRPDSDLKKELSRLRKDKLICPVSLKDEDLEQFVDVAGATPPDDLGDGEAATLVQARSLSAVAVVDERKALRVARGRFAEVTVANSMEFMLIPNIRNALDAAAFNRAILDARQYARMRIPNEYSAWFESL